MDALELLKTRKSISAAFLVSPGPTPAQLEAMLGIASRVPDHGKLTPWRFIVLEGDARVEASRRLGALYAAKNPAAEAKALDFENRQLAQAPTVVVIVSRAAPHPKIPEFEQLLSAANAAMNLELAAHAMGFAAQWTTGWAAYDPEAAAVLGLSAGERVVGFIHIGTPNAPLTDRPRPALADIVTRWQPG